MNNDEMESALVAVPTEGKTVSASELMHMVLDAIDVRTREEIQRAIIAEGQLRDMPPGARFDGARRVWVMPPAPGGAEAE